MDQAVGFCHRKETVTRKKICFLHNIEKLCNLSGDFYGENMVITPFRK